MHKKNNNNNKRLTLGLSWKHRPTRVLPKFHGEMTLESVRCLIVSPVNK